MGANCVSTNVKKPPLGFLEKRRFLTLFVELLCPYICVCAGGCGITPLDVYFTSYSQMLLLRHMKKLSSEVSEGNSNAFQLRSLNLRHAKCS